jgi:antitoxin HicB
MQGLRYTVVLESAEEGGYTVTVPALPAVVTEGETFEEAIEMAKEAISCYLEALAKEGRPLPIEGQSGERRVEHVEVAAPATA